MQWKISIGGIKKYAFEFAVDAAVSAMNTLGSLACVTAGASFAVASSSKDALSVSYFGASDTNGVFDFYLQLNGSVELNTSITFSHYEETDGDDGLSNYIKPAKLTIFGFVVGTTGTLLRVAASNIRTWRKGCDDSVQIGLQYNQGIKPPGREDTMMQPLLQYFPLFLAFF